VTVNLLRKCKTLCDYARTGIQLGADLRSKCLLASMLVRLKWLQAKSGDRTVYQVAVQIGSLRRTLRMRASDIFLVHEVLSQSPYIHPEMAQEPPRCIVDLGAHIGLATLGFKARFPEANVHCYEPDPDNFALLRTNTAGLFGVFFCTKKPSVPSEPRVCFISPRGATLLRRSFAHSMYNRWMK
jgi:hypothetical protein